MIWKLAREQMRTQPRYVRAAALLVVMATGLAGFAAIYAATQAESQRVFYHATGFDLENEAFVGVQSNGPTTRDGAALDRMTQDEASSVVSQLAASADRYTVTRTVLGFVEGLQASTFLEAYSGDVDWNALILDGTAPSAGEVAVTASTAKDLGVSLGDSLTLVRRTQSAGDANVPASLSLPIVGIARSDSQNQSPYSSIISWDDAPTLAEQFGLFAGRNAAGEITGSWDQSFWWTGGPTPDALAASTTTGLLTPTWSDHSDSWAFTVPAIIAGVVALTTIAAAFSAGRNQAQARSEWVGTARALGARRSTLVWAVVGESVAVAFAASAVGIGLAWVANEAVLMLSRRAHPDYLLAAHAHLPWPLGVGILALGLLLSLILSAVPAFWAARTEPAAALKPVAPIETVQLSRALPRRWLWAALAGAAVWTIAWGTAAGTGGSAIAGAAVTLGALVTGALAFMGAVEAIRVRVPRVGERLASSSRPSAVAAGDTLRTRPRQGVFPAIAMMLPAGLAVGVITAEAAVADPNLPFDPELMDEPVLRGFSAFASAGLTPGLLIALAMFVVAGVMVGVVSHAAFQRASGEHAARSALGLGPRDARVAAVIEVSVPMVLGALIGAVLGILVPFVGRSLAAAVSGVPMESFGWNVVVFVYALAGAVAVLLASLVGPAVTSLFAIRAASVSPPATALERSH